MTVHDWYDRPIGEHDWQSPEYVNDWIERDVTRDDQRRPLLQKMIGMAPFAREAPIRVLDVGAGYGLVSEQVLMIFPRAQLTLQDTLHQCLNMPGGGFTSMRAR